MNLMDLFIKVGVKDEASGSIKKISGAVGKGLATAAKVGIAALGAASAAVGALVTQSVKAYADYEQLVGGVETLFSSLDGTVSAAPKVLENAAKAYETAGLSANQYMETVTSFSAALVASLGNDYEAAARISDMAITDMADNANKMGTSMESIQAAYQGFAKQNYTMLDNLKLGYGGTKTEMERLLADAEKITGVKYDISNLADVYTAIHVIQGEIGITGTTAEEAASTISGSLGMLKASWANLMTGLADPNADIGKLFENVEKSAKTFAKNLKPVISRALKSMGSLVKDLAPVIAQELPWLVTEVLPDLISAAGSLIAGLAEALPKILNVIWETVDNEISKTSFGDLWTSIKEAVATAVEGIKEKWDELKTAIGDLKEKLQPLFDKFKDWEEENHILEGAIGLVGDAIEDVIQFITDLLNLGTGVWDMIAGAAEGSAERVDNAWSKVRDTFADIARILVGSGIANSPAAGVVLSGGGGGLSGLFSGGKKFAIGNDYVPYDNYPALLHRGEAVLTAREAAAWRRGMTGGQIVNNFSFNGVSQSDLDYIVGYVNRELVSG